MRGAAAYGTQDGVTWSGYLVAPDPARHPAPWPGVVVVHEAFGLTDDIKRQTDRIADEGYVALAIDLFAGNTLRCLVRAMRTVVTSRPGPELTQVETARTVLAERDDCTGRVGIIGFCMGGGFALLAARSGYDAAAPCYGPLPRPMREKLRGACPIVGSYGARDPELRGATRKLDTALTDLDIEHDVKEYPNSGHGFMTPHTGRWGFVERIPGLGGSPEEAADAWERVFDFFRDHLDSAA